VNSYKLDALAALAAEQFIESGAKNYVGEVFTIQHDGRQFDIVITVKPSETPDTHELRMLAEAKLHTLEHAVFHMLDDSCEIDDGGISICKHDFDKLCELVPEDWSGCDVG